MIEFEKVSMVFKGKKAGKQPGITALQDIDLTIQDGDIFGIIGYSGAGKSTLIRTINALLKPSSGRVLINRVPIASYRGKQLRQLRKKTGMIFQHFNLLNSKTVFANVALPLILEKKNRKEISQRVEELLQFVGLMDKAKSYPGELSGGQKQRVGIARALALNPSVLLCDEATSALDPQTTEAVLQLLKRINEQYKITIVIITHEMSVIQRICNRVAVLEGGKIIENGSVLDVFGNPQQLTTQHFVQTVIHDKLPENIRKFVVEKAVPGKIRQLIKLRFTGEKAMDPVIDRLIRSYDVHVNILFATMTEIQQTTLGHMVLSLSGSDHQLGEAVHFLKDQGIFVKEIKES
ncbi:MAG: methionine ABC transporter ATP-binding protein [Sporolactobacillus sp.]